ncbi:HET-domain-containing protein [Microthyrium microscopicum]|uniref:HET-domain-containing protein n=1 Tax=Microthyrium microscopicum TaxID=703497 RepID=A0A6A6UBP1_9PEZI|nr:HET-domain-containing protein [Microthyrium microscopicum]
MRLLSTSDRSIHDFMNEVPEYAILSHTWEDEEVTFQDVQAGNAEAKKGYQKIKKSCQIAEQDNIQWIWVDTCCIDKTSSAELTENINSMYVYYQNAIICYAYLSDVDYNDGDFELEMRASRWFTRGWTLQELIAPTSLRFYSKGWNLLTSKTVAAKLLFTITGIDVEVLQGTSPLFRNIAERMSWASQRRTTRGEDMAYSLMGIFGVNMPPIYGEGVASAFIRLQQEIIRRTSDQTSKTSTFHYRLKRFKSIRSGAR